MSPDAMLRLAMLLEEAAMALRSAATVVADLKVKIAEPMLVSINDHLSMRARKALRKLHITKLEQLEQVSGDQILGCKNTGLSTLIEIREVMARHGLYLLGEKHDPSDSNCRDSVGS